MNQIRKIVNLEMYRSKMYRAFVVTFFVLALSVPTFAQTPVPLDVMPAINSMMSGANSWMATLGPVVAIGFSIMIALGLLMMVGNLIVGAFKSFRGSK